MKRILRGLAAATLVAPLLLSDTGSARAALPPLIPRAVLFGQGVQGNPRISPDGTRLAYFARSQEGNNVWVRPLGDAPAARGDTARQVTHERHGIYGFHWAADGKHILYLKDSDGDENYHLYSADLNSTIVRDLTPFQGARTQTMLADPHHPNELLVGLNVRDPKVFDMYRVRLDDGAVTLDTRNPGDVIEWAVDDDFVIRAATALDAKDASTIIRVRDRAGSPWRDLIHWSFDEAGSDRAQKVIDFTPDGRSLIVQDPAGANTTRLVTVDAATGKTTSVIASDSRCDLWTWFDFSASTSPVAMLMNPKTGRVQAIGFEYLKPEWKVLDPALKADFQRLQRFRPGIMDIVDRDAADAHWIVEYDSDVGSNSFALYDRKNQRITTLFETQPAFAKYKFAERKPIVIKAVDGMEIPCYLTVPVGVAVKKLPLVMLIHGGPWFRDSWGFDPQAQWLANRGYAVLQVNFRGSTGFGRKFINAADHEFGNGKVLRDISDALQWAVKTGIADPKRVGIMGGSFGGYATLCGLTFTPSQYACGVDIVGPSDVKALIESFPAYWGPRKQRWLNRFGDVIKDPTLNRDISPLYHLDAIRAPLLIGHGANDPRVPIANSEKLVAALRAKNLDVIYVVYPDEGHGFGRAENIDDFYGRAEEFLARHLKGRAEKWVDVKGTSAQMR
jgi:dipeptidyl aminopeptidase/acylaminoacyl peptidase